MWAHATNQHALRRYKGSEGGGLTFLFDLLVGWLGRVSCGEPVD